MADPARLVSSRRLLPFPGTPRRCSLGLLEAGETAGLSPDVVKSYLLCHGDVLEEFVLDFIDNDVIEAWMKKKRLPGSSFNEAKNPRAPCPQNKYNSNEITSIQQTLLKQIFGNQDFLPMMNELCNVVGLGVGADSCMMYALKTGGKELCMFIPPSAKSSYLLKVYGPVGKGSTVAAHVAVTKDALLVTDLLADERFPRGVGIETSLTGSVICLPVLLPTADLMCIMEFVRGEHSKPFDESNFQAALAPVSWIGMTLYQCQMNKTLMKQADLNEFLLEVSKIIFDDVVAMDRLVEKIMVYTKNLVNADRCSLFLVDSDREELYANLFDEGRYRDGKPCFVRKDEVRFSVTRGIAGQVATTAEVLNIPDAYSDPRFNREIDRLTGYTTRSILCMPIISKGTVIGVVQMINKKGDTGVFTKTDESSFKMFAVYCALALHYSKLYRTIQLRTAHYKVAMEQLSFHAQVPAEELSVITQARKLTNKQIPHDFATFFYYIEPEKEGLMCQLYIHMLDDLLGPDCFENEKLGRFVLTVKRNYRPLAYHNWNHGFMVAHGMYAILKAVAPSRPHLFTTLRMQALMLACLCHDIDHRGYNNTFLQKFNEPLAVLYETSTMEQHHYMLTVKILQQEDIFKNLSGDDYALLLQYIQHAIIATDLSVHLSTHKTLGKLVVSQALDIDNPEHFEDVVGLMMTAADLMVCCKSWPVQKDTVKLIYEEFYNQGDLEKMLGSQPLPMMDRDNSQNMSKNQVGFMKIVCCPCYQTLASIFPECTPLYDSCKDNMAQWERVVEGKSTKCWEPDKSRV